MRSCLHLLVYNEELSALIQVYNEELSALIGVYYSEELSPHIGV